MLFNFNAKLLIVSQHKPIYKSIASFGFTCMLLLIWCRPGLYGQEQQHLSNNSDSLIISQIYQEALHGHAHENLRVLCKDVGARLSGSPEAEKAVQWGYDLLKSYAFDSVFLQEVMVPKWERGCCESGTIFHKGEQIAINISALGGSVGCEKPIKAQVIEVKYFTDLAELGEDKIKGKIVFFNRAMDPLLINTGAAYGGANDQRTRGAAEAAKYGAIGTLVRSLTLADDEFPHTGAMDYGDTQKKIPAAAISTADAKKLSALLKENPSLEVSFDLRCVRHPDVLSHNVIAEIRGSEFPDKYIVVGGHLDSWDIGEGAHDDGAGIVQSIEVLRLFKALGIRPRHTLRLVLFINEENGNRGGITYARIAKETGMNHIAAIESDAGGFTPRGFSIDANENQVERFKSWAALFEPYLIHVFREGHSGVDIGPLKDGKVALIGLSPDGQRYFDYHHSDRDIFENVHKRELELGAGTVTALTWLIDQYGWPED
jgi:hypothetical protein